MPRDRLLAAVVSAIVLFVCAGLSVTFAQAGTGPRISPCSLLRLKIFCSYGTGFGPVNGCSVDAMEYIEILPLLKVQLQIGRASCPLAVS
jgi:hypothetical protein